MKKLQFPKNFLWGTTTSAHQVEGNNYNDWSKWEKSEARIKGLKSKGRDPKNYISGKATDHYNHYEEDLDLIKNLNNNAYRLSIEWSRIESEEGKFNQKEIKHYKKVLESLKNKNIKTMVTLWHFTNPLWFSKIGGWKNKKAIEYFTHYTQFIAKNLGKYIDFWITLNEPSLYARTAYLGGYWPPEEKSLFSYLKVIKNLIEAHQKSYQTLHQINKKIKVGLAENIASWDSHPLTPLFSYLRDFFFLTHCKNYLDFIGLNYYFHFRFKFLIPICSGGQEKSDIDWEIYPQGIYEVCKKIKKYNLPIYITENGLADKKDKLRSKFILEHLKYLQKAIQKGVDIHGYFHWSLLDNFEWREGFFPRFGLIEVDYKTFKRTPRKSALMYSEICKENGITEEIVRKYKPKLLNKIFNF